MINSEILNNACILVVGCGGLGGYVIESLVRLGFMHIVAVDGDTFDKSNLNRQLYATFDTIGKNKAIVARDRALSINNNIHFVAIEKYLDETNADELVSSCTIIIDALDNSKTRLLLEDVATKHNIPIIHGAIDSCFGEIGVVMPNDGLLHSLYKRNKDKVVSNNAASCAIVANLEVNEAIKVLENKPHLKKNELLLLDLETLTFTIVNVNNASKNR